MNSKTINDFFLLVLETSFMPEELSLTEWRSQYKHEFGDALTQMHLECTNITENCTLLLSQISTSHGIVCMKKKQLR